MSDSAELHQVEKATEAQEKAKAWSIVGPVVAVVVGVVTDVKPTPAEGAERLLPGPGGDWPKP